MDYELISDETKEEWEYAEKQARTIIDRYKQRGIILAKDSVVKIRRKDHNPQLKHSFYIVGEQLYCGDSTDGLDTDSGLIEEVYLTGAHSKVKFAKSKDGHFVRLRIVHLSDHNFNPNDRAQFTERYGTEAHVLNTRGDLVGYGLRVFNQPVPFFKKAILDEDGNPSRPDSTTRFKIITIIEDAGESLDKVVNRMNAAQRKLTTVLTCKDVQRIHRLRVIHRDLKPENIGVVISDKDPFDICVRVFDFTDSRFLPANQDQGQTNSLEGTPGFISYEVFNSSVSNNIASFSFRSDLVALGVSLMEVAKGVGLDDMRKIIHDDLVPGYVQFDPQIAYREGRITKSFYEIIYNLRSKLSDDLWNHSCNNPKNYFNKPENYLIDTLLDVTEIAICEGYHSAAIIKDINTLIKVIMVSNFSDSFKQLNQVLDQAQSQNDVQTKAALIAMLREFSRDKSLYANKDIATINTADVVNALKAKIHEIKNGFDVEMAKRAAAGLRGLNNNTNISNSNNNQPAKTEVGSANQESDKDSHKRPQNFDKDRDDISSNGLNNNNNNNNSKKNSHKKHKKKNS